MNLSYPWRTGIIFMSYSKWFLVLEANQLKSADRQELTLSFRLQQQISLTALKDYTNSHLKKH